MTNEQIVSGYMTKYYTDERLSWLLAHAESGALSFWSCCCFIGIPSSDHALRGEIEGFKGQIGTHYDTMRRGYMWDEAGIAERAYRSLGDTDAERRAKLIPLIRAEMERRLLLHSEQSSIPETEALCVAR